MRTYTFFSFDSLYFLFGEFYEWENRKIITQIQVSIDSILFFSSHTFHMVYYIYIFVIWFKIQPIKLTRFLTLRLPFFLIILHSNCICRRRRRRWCCCCFSYCCCVIVAVIVVVVLVISHSCVLSLSIQLSHWIHKLKTICLKNHRIIYILPIAIFAYIIININ